MVEDKARDANDRAGWEREAEEPDGLVFGRGVGPIGRFAQGREESRDATDGDRAMRKEG